MHHYSCSRALFVQSCPCLTLGITNDTRARLDKSTAAPSLRHHNEQLIIRLACSLDDRYLLPVAANSAAGRRNPNSKRRYSAQITTAGVFFRLQFRVMAAVCGQASAWSGPFCPGIPTPRMAATQSRRKDRGSSTAKGATSMTALIPPSIRLAAHKAMALAALRANSSLSVRLRRYNHHMQQARYLEAQGGAK